MLYTLIHVTLLFIYLFYAFLLGFTVHSMSVDDTHHRYLFDENTALIEMPLIAPVSTHYQHHRHNAYYPYNLTAFQISPSMDSMTIDTGNSMEKEQSR